MPIQGAKRRPTHPRRQTSARLIWVLIITLVAHALTQSQIRPPFVYRHFFSSFFCSSDCVWITQQHSPEKNILANCLYMCVCVCVWIWWEGVDGAATFRMLSYKQVRTPSSINPATNCFDQFVVSIQFKSSPQARVCVRACVHVCVILFINCTLVFGLWLQPGRETAGYSRIIWEHITHTQTHTHTHTHTHTQTSLATFGK